MTTAHYRSVPRVARRATPLAWRLSRLGMLIMTWFWRTRLRRELWQLSDEQLRDVGLTREMIQREAEKPFWMV
jgi:uncharacterized protein YjiS (DUF1127 family)